MSPNRPDNLCHLAGCPDLCCKGTYLTAKEPMSQKDFENFIAGVPDVLIDYISRENFRLIQGLASSRTKELVIVHQMGDEIGYLVQLSGSCVHLTSEGCGIDDIRPDSCQRFELDGYGCNKIRQRG